MRLQRNVKARNGKATDTVGDEFESRWLKRLGLPSAWREPAQKHLEQLSFSNPQHTWPLVHQVSDWCSGAAANFGRMREAKRENTRCGL
jgi:hypothetical protein